MAQRRRGRRGAEAAEVQRKTPMHVSEEAGGCIVSADTPVCWALSPRGFSDFGGRLRLLFFAFSANSTLNDELRAAPDNSDEMPAGIKDNFASSPPHGRAGPWHPADSASPVRVKMLYGETAGWLCRLDSTGYRRRLDDSGRHGRSIISRPRCRSIISRFRCRSGAAFPSSDANAEEQRRLGQFHGRGEQRADAERAAGAVIVFDGNLNQCRPGISPPSASSDGGHRPVGNG